jgi:hypothetical protein
MVYQSMNTITKNDFPILIDYVLMELGSSASMETLEENFFFRYFDILMRQKQDFSLDRETRNLYLTWNHNIRCIVRENGENRRFGI